MKADVESLWRELVEVLHSRGELPLQHDLFTAGEIAKTVSRTSGDPRVQRFVWEYYYPRRYGQVDGSLSDEAAAALVESLRRHPNPTEAAPVEQAPAGPKCEICRKHPVDGAAPRRRGPAA